jgi:hypothetical protein
MKVIIISVILVCLAFPAFSQQDARLRSLSDSMGSTISESNSALAEFDQMMAENANSKAYSVYLQQYRALTAALQESEFRLTRLIQSNSRIAVIREERYRFEGFVRQLETVKSEYDEWLRSIR